MALLSRRVQVLAGWQRNKFREVKMQWATVQGRQGKKKKTLIERPQLESSRGCGEIT